MAEKSIVTRWGQEVGPDNVWQAYPRPQFARSAWKNLNGLWDVRVQPQTRAEPAQYQDKILVPFCVESALSGVGQDVGPTDRIWYRRQFSVPKRWRTQRTILHFEAVDWSCSVWVNGALVGAHKGAYDRFSFDISAYLKDSGAQTLVVCVDDPSSLGTQARGKQQMPQQGIWYTPVSGIWQTVWLESVPKQGALREVKIRPDIDQDSVTVVPLLWEPTDQDVQVKISILDGSTQVAQAQVRADQATTIKLSNPRLWSPDSPFLYDLKLESLQPDSDQVLDTVSSYFGMRKISLGDGPANKIMYLNNRPLFHYGTLDQGWWPDGLHTAPSDAALKYDIQKTKDMGFNMIRKHIKVEPARWYYWCDKLGILVWQDMPSGMVVIPQQGKDQRGRPKRPAHVQHVGRTAPDLERRSADSAQFEWELRRMMDQHMNAPCIVMWVPFNEGWGQYDTARISDAVKAYDPSRLVNAVSGWALRPCGDIYDIHSYQTKVTVPKVFADRASVVGEYGGIGYPVKGHLWNPEMRNWGYQTYQSQEDLLKNYIAKFEQIVAMKAKGVCAAVYTQTTDVEGEVNGLMTYDREVIKMEPAKLRELHSVLYEEK